MDDFKRWCFFWANLKGPNHFGPNNGFWQFGSNNQKGRMLFGPKIFICCMVKYSFQFFSWQNIWVLLDWPKLTWSNAIIGGRHDWPNGTNGRKNNITSKKKSKLFLIY
jgi:hypothetical protein